MRILRIRRGYTTNSSGANEYVPGALSGSSKTPPPSTTPPPKSTSTTAPSASASADAGVAPSASVTARRDAGTDAGPALATTTSQPVQPAPEPPPPQPVDNTASNVGQIGCIGAVVLFLSLFGWRFAKKRQGLELEGD